VCVCVCACVCARVRVCVCVCACVCVYNEVFRPWFLPKSLSRRAIDINFKGSLKKLIAEAQIRSHETVRHDRRTPYVSVFLTVDSQTIALTWMYIYGLPLISSLVYFHFSFPSFVRLKV
jgi:hypothetical protein